MKGIRNLFREKAHQLKRLIQKFYLGVYKKTSVPKDPKTPYYTECVNICKKLLSQKDTILLIAPISSKRYIKNEKHGIYVVFYGKSIEVINHVYNYTIRLDEKTWESLIDEFNYELEERRIKFEDEISKNIRYSLKTILKSIEEKNEDK